MWQSLREFLAQQPGDNEHLGAYLAHFFQRIHDETGQLPRRGDAQALAEAVRDHAPYVDYVALLDRFAEVAQSETVRYPFKYVASMLEKEPDAT